MGTISQANESVLAFKAESAWGTQATGTYSVCRIVSAALAQRTGFTQSAQLNTSRQPTDTIRNQVSSEGNIAFEFSAVAHQAFMESLMGNTFSADIQTAIDADVTTVSSPTAHWLATGAWTNVRQGDWVRATGFVNAANDGSFYVSQKVSNNDIVIYNASAVAETTAVGVKLSSSRLAVGTTLSSMTLEQKIPGVSQNLYHRARGSVMTGLRLDIAPGEIIRGTFDFAGKNVTQHTASIAAGFDPILTTQIANALDNVIQIREGAMSPAEGWKVASFSLNVNSPAEPRYAISDAPNIAPGAVGMALRPMSATATLRVFVEHALGETDGVQAIMDSYLAGTERNGLAIVLADNVAAAKTHTIFHFNKYKLTRCDVPIGGNDQDLFLEMEIAAVQDPNAGLNHDATSLGPWAFMIHQTKTF